MAKALLVPVFPYPATRALEEMSYYITDLNDINESYRQIGEFVQEAASVHHMPSLTLRASNGVIDRQSPNWIEIRDALRDAGYTVRTNNQLDLAEIVWG